MRLITDIENDIQNKQTELDQTTHEIGRSILINTIADLEIEKKNAEEALSQQERVEAQEAEVQAITLPYDFNELFSEEGHQITNANEMIIEVVKDTKRQANIEKNQALDEQKAGYEAKLKMVYSQHDSLDEELRSLQDSYRSLSDENLSNSALKQKAESATAQANLERDDAFNKRDAAFRQLEEANEIIKGLKIKLENVPAAAQSFDISPSDKLAQMVKESLADKVNRGLARWDIPVLETPAIPFVNEATRQDEAATDKLPIEEEIRTAAFGLAQESSNGDREVVEESEVITLESLQDQVNTLKAQVKVLCDVSIVDVEEAIKAVA